MSKTTKALALGLCFSAMYAVMPHGAKAQVGIGTGVSNSESRSGSVSGAAANNQGNRFNSSTSTQQGVTFNQNSVSNGAPIPNTGYTNNINSGDVTVRTTPTVYAPPVSGGNPCTLAVSGAVSVIGWGAAAGGTFVDQDCANRQKIAMMHNAGYQQAAKELMCNDRDSYYAFRTAGTPCAIRQAFEQPVAAQAQPLPPARPAGAPVAPVSQPMTISSSGPVTNEWCRAPMSLHTMPNGTVSCF